MAFSPIILLSVPDDSSFILGLGSSNMLRQETVDFEVIDQFIETNKGRYIFSTLSYDIKNSIEKLKSENHDEIQFPLCAFWTAEVVLKLEHLLDPNLHMKYSVLEGKLSEDHVLELDKFSEVFQRSKKLPIVYFKNRITKELYLQKVREIQREIQLGNVYELNFCQEFYAENVPIFDSYSLLKSLLQVSKAPFSCYVKLNEHELFCGSPERFIKTDKNRLLSQPIKGTVKRGKNQEEDEDLKNLLLNDPKERAENIMITDLVRNDLSKVAAKNSVSVDELCGLYSFGTVHQLISTISCEMKAKTPFTEIIKATFPMGSMTGAPKVNAMKLIEQYESFQRGVYSGTVGYFDPNGEFDFNVVIRSLIYNKEKNYLSCSVGGAITMQSNPEKEYEECLTKVQRLMQLFSQ